MDAQQLKKMLPLCDAAKWAEPLTIAMEQFEINTPQRIAGFLANLAVESRELTRLEENLNYHADDLCRVWPKRFPSMAAAMAYAGNPKKLANHVYCNRNGNGDEASGDGWAFRGRGPIMLTGRANYLAIGNALGVDLVSSPDTLKLPKIASLVSAYFFKKAGGNEKSDKGNLAQVRKAVNGGLIEFDDFKIYHKKILAVLQGAPVTKVKVDKIDVPPPDEPPLFGAV